MPLLRLLLAVSAVLCMADCAVGKNLLFVRDSQVSYGSEELARVQQFQNWGYTVTWIVDGTTQTAFNTAVAMVDVVYVPSTIDDYQLLYNLRLAPCGVVTETHGLDEEFGFADGDGYVQTSATIEFTVNTHPVSADLATGTVTIINGSQAIAINGNTIASGMEVLAGWTFGGLTLGVMEKDATLANTYNGNSTASGRRVRLPWSGSTFTVSSLNTSGLSILENALAWASADAGFVAHWTFDEGTGTTVADESGSGNDATFNTGTPAWISGPREGALEFNGSNSVDTDATFDPPGTGTVAFWFKPNGIPSSVQNVLGSSGNWEVTFKTDGTLDFDFGVIGGGFGNGFVFSTTDRWYHVVAVYNSDDDTYSVYLDGELLTSGSSSISDQPAAILSIGARTGSSERFEGALDDLRVYNYELSATEILELYGLVAHWTFDEGTGTTVADSSGIGNDASFSTGTPAWTSGPRKKALEFSGSNSVDTDADFDPPETGSVAFWFRPNGTPDSLQRLLGITTSWEVTFLSNGTLGFDLGAGAGFNSGAVFSTTDRWYHIAAIYNSGSDTYSLYLNGELLSSGSHSLSDQPAGILSIGTRTGMTDRFDGALDDLRIYNYELTAAEVAELYGLLGHWKLDENLGTTAIDSSGIGNDGTYQGGSSLGNTGPYPGTGYNAIEFEGNTGDKADLPTMEYDFSDGFTATVWVNPTAALATGEACTFLNLSNGANVDQIWFGWVKGVGLQLYLTDTVDSSSLKTIEDNTDFAVNEWVHCIAVVDANGDASLYRNGVLTKTGFNVSLPTDVVRIQNAIATSPSNENFEGFMYGMRLYNRPLAEYEIATIYGQVGWWKFDETSGSTAYDSSGMHHDATNAGSSSWESGITGGAVELPGDSSDFFTNTTIANDLNGATGFGAMMWVKSDQVNQDRGIFHGKATASSANYQVGLRYDQSGYHGAGTSSMKATVRSASGISQLEGESNTQVTSWQHLAMSWNSGSSITLWVDGVKQTPILTSGTPTGVLAGFEELAIGIGINCSNWDGRMDQFRIFNRAITQEEVLREFNGVETSLGVQIVKWIEVQ